MIAFQVVGAQFIQAKLAAMAKFATGAVQMTGLDQCAALVTRRAKQKAPVDLGHLRSTIQPDRPNPNEADVISHADYSIYQEFGTGIYAENGEGRKTPWVYFNEKTGEFVKTKGNKPHPYMRPAMDESKEEMEHILGVTVITACHGVGIK